MINEVKGMTWDDLKLRALTNTDDITQLKKKMLELLMNQINN